MNVKSLSSSFPQLPYPEFPLRPHRNGQWFASVWNPRTKKSEQFYFGSWKTDAKGELALNDPQFGWLARRSAIKVGTDNVRVEAVGDVMTLGELMARFLTYKRGQTLSGELSRVTLGDYLKEIEAFVSFMKPSLPPGSLRPEHFSAYMKHLFEQRKLGRHSRKRVRAYVSAFLHYGARNGWFQMPATGADWISPAVDPDAMRIAKARAGVQDFSERILTGEEIDKLLQRADPTFKALILVATNCGVGPADIARVRWNMIDLDKRRLNFPRQKTGTPRVGYLWKRTCTALRRVRGLKHNREALLREGESALVFLTRRGRAFYRETEIYGDVEVNGLQVKKLIAIKVHKPILCTFGRMVRELGLTGVSFYRCRHTFRTLAKRARDKETIDLMMGHRTADSSRVYDHAGIPWRRVRRVARIVYRRLWPKVRPKEDTPRPKKQLARVSVGAEKAGLLEQTNSSAALCRRGLHD